MEKNRFRNYVRRRSKFRSFLNECLENYRAMKRRAENAQKRSGKAETIEFQDGVTPAATPPADSAARLDHDIAIEIHEKVRAALEDKYGRSCRSERVRTLLPFVLAEPGMDTRAAAGARLGMTPNHLRQEFKLREAYYVLFRKSVADISPRDEIDQEMRYLISLLAA